MVLLVCGVAIKSARFSSAAPLQHEIVLASLQVSAGTARTASDKKSSVRSIPLAAMPASQVAPRQATAPVVPIASGLAPQQVVVQPQPVASAGVAPATVREPATTTPAAPGPHSAAAVATPVAAPQGPLPIGASGAPAFEHQVAPLYPALARRTGREGTVILKLAIDADGKLERVEVLQAAGFGFTEAAVAAIRQSTYRAARKSGQAVQAQALVTVRFRLRS